MSDYTEEQIQQFHKLVEREARKKKKPETNPERVQILKKRDTSLLYIMLANIVFVALFLYSFYAGITQLGKYWLLFIVVIFVANIWLIFFQKSQLKKAITYFSQSEDKSS